MKKERVVISVSGSLVVPGSIDVTFLNEFTKLIKRHADKQFILVVGGGRPARASQDAISVIAEPTHKDLDWLGIMATRMNAELLRVALGSAAHPMVVYDPTKPLPTNKVVVAAGWKPGFSSDYVAVEIAKRIKANVMINLTYIDHVYDKDPRKHVDAKPLYTLLWSDFFKLVGDDWKPGMNAPFDPLAARAAQKAKVAVLVMNGAKLANLEKLLSGEAFVGTLIS